MRVVWTVILMLTVTGCVENPAYDKSPVYRDLTGKKRSDGELRMSQAYCRNVVNSYSPEYNTNGGMYYSGTGGRALGSAITKVKRGMDGPSYVDCMTSQGFELVGYK